MSFGDWWHDNVTSPIGDFLYDVVDFALAPVNWVMDWLTPDLPDIPNITQKFQVNAVLDPNYTLPVIYGETEVGGNIIFYDVAGTNNEYLDVVVAIAEGEIEAFTEVYLNDDPLPILKNASGLSSSSSSEIKLSTLYNALYQGYVEGYLYTGTAAQAANSQLISSHTGSAIVLPDPLTGDSAEYNTPAGWTTNHKLTDIVYAYFRFTHNPDLFGGSIPKLKFKVKGRKVYDPRTSTTIYSANNAVCLYDYLTQSTYSYGKGLSTSEVNTASVIAAANACDVVRNGFDVSSSPVTYASYEIAAVVDNASQVKDNIPYFLQSMNANLPYVDGTYFLNVEGSGTSSVTFTEDDIVGNISVSSSSKNTRYNSVIVSFGDKERHYKVSNAPISSATYLATDNGEKLETRITVPYVDYYPRAKDIAELVMNKSRADKAVNFTSTMKALQTVPGDIVGLTHDSFGFSNKQFRVSSLGIRVDGLVDVALIEHDNAFYTLTDKYEQPAYTDTKLQYANYTKAPTGLTLLSDNTTTVTNVDGLVQPRIYATWTNADSYAGDFFVYLKKSTDVDYIKVGRTKNTAFYIPNVIWSTQYDVAVSAINGLGFESTQTSASITVANPLADAIYNYPDVKGLELIGEGTDQGLGNVTDFTGKDIKLQWRLSSSNVTFEFGSTAAEQMGAVGGVLPFTLKGYRVEIYHPNDTQPRQEYFVTQPNFVYSLDKNIEDGDGTPSRTITFQVYAVGQVAGAGISGESETAAKITVSNPAPALPSNVTIAKGFQTITLKYDRPSLGDWSGILVWMDTSTSFTPSASNLVYSGVDNTIVLSGLTTGTTYYIKYGLTDTFVPSDQTDTTSLTMSAEYSITTDTAVTSTEIQSIIADKIAAGTLGEAVTLGGVFVASGTSAVLNGTGPALGTYRLDVGPVAHTGATYVLNYYNGYDDAHGSYVSKFSIDESGNALFGGDIILDTNNYWKASNNTFQIGDGSNNITWDGTDLTVYTLKTASGSGKRVELNSSGNNELRFYGDRGDTTIELLATVGITTSGSDNIIGYFGSTNTSLVAVEALSGSSTALNAISSSGVGVFSRTATGTSTAYLDNVRTTDPGSTLATVLRIKASNVGTYTSQMWFETTFASAGAPTTGTWSAGEVIVDSNYKVWICSVGGTPGTWKAFGT